MMDAGARIADFLAFLKEAEARYLSAQEDERTANDETQDILHTLEFQRYSKEQAAYLADTLSGVRQKRRRAKDDRAIAGLVVSWMTDNSKVIRSLERLQSNVQTELREKEKRSYNLRTNILSFLDGEIDKGGHDNESVSEPMA